jgi:S1-C subfamily serine protease
MTRASCVVGFPLLAGTGFFLASGRGEAIPIADRVVQAQKWTVGVESRTGFATGVIVSRAGIVLTSGSAVGSDSSFTVVARGKPPYSARVLERDSVLDLVVARVCSGRMTASADTGPAMFREDDEVVVVGYGRSRGERKATGLLGVEDVSEPRRFLVSVPSDDLLRGGPVVDSTGALVGLLTGPEAGPGSSMLAVHLRAARPLIDRAIRRDSGRTIIQGQLREVERIAARPELGRRDGLYLEGDGHVARPRGDDLLVGDIIFEGDGEPIRNRSDLSQLLRSRGPCSRVPVRVHRRGKDTNATAVLVQAP